MWGTPHSFRSRLPCLPVSSSRARWKPYFVLGLPRALGAVLILIVALAAVAALVALIWAPSQQWYASAPHSFRLFNENLHPWLA